MDPVQTRLLTAAEVAAFFRCRKDTVYVMVRDGRLPAYRVGRRFLFRQEDVEALVGAA